MSESGVVMMVVFMIIYCSVFLAIFAAMYILESLALFRIATRRNLPKPWLAWIPCGSSWLLGCISDQYRYSVHGQVTTRRKKLLTLSIVLFAVLFLFSCIAGVIVGISVTAEAIAADVTATIISFGILFLLCYIGVFVISIVFTVQNYMALFDLYRSCKPSLAMLFLMLSIFVAPSCAFMFAVRNKDDGMVPQINA